MNRILIVGPSWVGDMVMSQTLFKLLKQQEPDCHIDVLAPEWSLPILQRMPEVADGITLPFKHGELKLSERLQFGKKLAGKYQRAIVIPNSLKSVLIPFAAEIKTRIGWRGEMRFFLLNDIRLLNKKRYPLMIQRLAALAFEANAPLPEALPHPELQTSDAAQKNITDKLELSTERKTLVLCPGAEFGNAKQWPEEHYAKVAEEKISTGWQVWIVGSKNDQTTATKIIDHIPRQSLPHCHNLTGKTQLEETIDLIAQAQAVITNDSGLMHIAAAVNTPLVVIYGSTSPNFTPPLSNRVSILQSSLDCAPCFKRECPLGHRNCLVDQTPQRVIDAMESLLTAEVSLP